MSKAKANKSTDRLPDRKSDIQPEYPYNQVYTWPGGHELHIDSTPGKERIRIGHSSGTFTEIYANGDRTDVVVGNQQVANKSGVTLSINNNGDISIGGQGRFLVGGGAHIEVAGDAGIAVGGDTMLVGGGNLKASIQDIYLGARGNLNMNIAKNTNIRTAGNMKLETKGNAQIVTEGSLTMNTKGDVAQTSEGKTVVKAEGTMTSESSAVSYVRGSQVQINDGGNSGTPTATPAIPSV